MQLTETGRRKVDEVIESRFAEASEVEALLAPAERRQLAKILAKLDRGLVCAEGE